MLPRHLQLLPSLTILTLTLVTSLIHAGPTGAELTFDVTKRDKNPLSVDWNSAPSPEDDPAFSAGALRDTKYLPAQVGGIVAAYGISLVLVAITLLSLAKKRREHLHLGDDEFEYQGSNELYGNDSPVDGYNPFLVSNPSREIVPNFSYPSPLRTQFNEQLLSPHAPYIHPSPTSTCNLPGVDPYVDQAVVSADRDMAQSQLEEMYKHVMEQEDAKQRGIVLEAPDVLAASSQRISSSDKSVTSPRKDRVKPANLNLNAAAHDDKTQSRTSSFFASLRSPRKKQVKGVNISSPIMTPQSGTFPRHELQEMSAMPSRSYAPPPPPPIPTNQIPFGAHVGNGGAIPTPNMSPESIQSIDGRINSRIGPPKTRHAASEVDPGSASSEHSQTPLVGLPLSPKPGARFPALPSSPKPGATFSRANAPSAVRTGGNLPLRAYEPALSSPSTVSRTTKQTVFERRGPLSPTNGRTLMTAGAVPYSPYQPFTPVVPITPSLVTKEDRKRMRRMMPKTPTIEMVKGSDEMW
ncbi:hypothetical protein C2857_005952 [Epichloe festucae Fl1]|uniref:Uncharacterized protein n=1 Tax=Epichloe festucae (strain Fl1) TaxID=877507 RepID=A0A7S9KLB1_EPIFF|nr:hypothetical protein C2857_005952 [Epichloe festucae Fl1]